MRTPLLLILCLAISSCVSGPSGAPTSTPVGDPYPGSGGKFLGTPSFPSKFDTSKFSAFQVGTTTKAQVATTLGKPDGWVTRNDATSQFEYAYAGETSRLAGQTMTKIVYVLFTFDANKTLVKLEYPGHDSNQ
jgi:hypothetical protein